jgi:hypothetical protein
MADPPHRISIVRGRTHRWRHCDRRLHRQRLSHPGGYRPEGRNREPVGRSSALRPSAQCHHDIIHVVEPDAFVGYAKSSGPQQQGLIDLGRQPQAEKLRHERQQTQAFEAALRADGVRVGRAITVQRPTSEMRMAISRTNARCMTAAPSMCG